MPSCKQCSSAFEVTKEDLAFLEKVSPVFQGEKELIPPPQLCPDCRLQRRFTFRNEWKLYHRKCDFTGKQMVSVYSPDKPYKVFEQQVWWSDAFDPLQYGREYDFGRSFFTQFDVLNRAVPKCAIHNANSENCEYTNYSAENRNCYLVVGGLGAEDCLYSYRVFYSSDCVDCYDLIRCQRCYECSESHMLYDCVSCRNCQNSSDLLHCIDCTGCQHCYGCAGLRNKKFHIYNTPFSEQEYREKVQALGVIPSSAVQQDIFKLHLRVPHRFAQIIQSEGSTGDQLLECRDCTDCFTFKHSQDCSHCLIGEKSRDCRDCNFCDNCEMQYNCCNLEKNYQNICGMFVWYCKDMLYCMNCLNSHHCFGCSGLKKHSYCILNRQYTKEEYEEFVPKMIEHMRQSGEWGLYFDPALSPFGYNESLAHEYFPLTKKDALGRGWKWFEESQSQEQYFGPAVEISEHISEVGDDVTRQILRCSITGKPYKIIPQELQFYRTMGIPIPRKCPDQRHKERMALRNPRKLWSRKCQKCGKGIETTYAPERPEIVYCEECYLSTVY
ncbi:MAG: hypothetical protein PHO92_03940 [Candidatus Peribacteraceae bacterium]|nr:hypothetical protein [Candidatus Peribacteraceae bacterium]